MYWGIFLYTIIWIVSCLIVCYHYNRQIRSNIEWEGDGTGHRHNIKMPIFTALGISGLFTLFNVYATTHSNIIGADRRNYILNFIGYRPTSSIGLGFMIDLVHLIGGDIQTLFYITTFISVFITLMAYRLSKKADPYVFYLLCITQYFLSTLVNLKQCYASAFAVLFFVLILEYRFKISRFAAIACIVLACLFHPTGYILIPIYIILALGRSRRNITLYFCMLLVGGLFLDRFALGTARLLRTVIPSLASKILEYFSESGNLAQEGIGYSFLKGIPYYIIVLIGAVGRRNYRKSIEHYDDYLIIVGTGAFIYLLSIYSVWLGRFVHFFSFVSFTLFSQLLSAMKIKGNKIIYSIVVQISLILVTYRFLYLVYKLYGGF